MSVINKSIISAIEKAVTTAKDDLEKELREVIKEAIQKEEDGLGIGFSAARQTSKSFKNGEKIVFEKVWLNIGSGYNVNTGIFVANKTGLYSFSATIMAMESKKSVSCAFVVNDQIRTRIYGATDFAPGVRTEVMKLSVGDEVYIKMTADGGIYGGLWSSISGHLIK